MHKSSMDQREEKSAHITGGQVAPHRLPNSTTNRLTDCKCPVGMKTSALNQVYRTLEFNLCVIINDNQKNIVIFHSQTYTKHCQNHLTMLG